MNLCVWRILTLSSYSHFAQGHIPYLFSTYIPCAILEFSGTIPELADRVRYPLCAGQFRNCTDSYFAPNIYISVRISTWAGYTTIIRDYVTWFMRDCVCLLRRQCLISYYRYAPVSVTSCPNKWPSRKQYRCIYLPYFAFVFESINEDFSVTVEWERLLYLNVKFC